LQGCGLGGGKLVAEAALLHFAVDFDVDRGSGRRVGETDMVVGGDQKTGGARRRVVDGFADFGVDYFDNAADDVSGCAKLAEFTRLFDLFKYMFE